MMRHERHERSSTSWMLAEFGDGDACASAARALRSAGYRRLDGHSPYPHVGLEAALEVPRSRIPRYVLLGGIAGAILGFGLQYYLDGIDYPLDVGARPLLSVPAFIPITFETTILVAALTAFVAFFAEARLPRLSQPLFEVDGFESAVVDRFWLSVETSDAAYDPAAAKQLFEAHGALRIVVKEDAS